MSLLQRDGGAAAGPPWLTGRVLACPAASVRRRAKTRACGGDRDMPCGPSARVAWAMLMVGGDSFSPGSSDRVSIGLLGLAW